MRTTLRDYDLGPGRVRGFIHRRGSNLHAAIQPDVSRESRRCFEVELKGREIRPPKTANTFITWPSCYEEIDVNSVRANREVIEAEEPEWVQRVRDLWITYRDFTHVVFYSRLEPEAVKAIVEILYERGEIPPDGEVF